MGTPHDPAEYGRHIADDYDRIYGDIFDTEGAVARLLDLAAGGSVLELGVGTGRLAIPLARAGLAVHGIDGSATMLEQLAGRPGGELITATEGDFSKVSVEGRFALAVLAANTIYALPDQDAQVACFANVARHLQPGGRFVVEAWVPNPTTLDEPLRPRRLSAGHAGLVMSEHDPVRQVLATVQVVLGGTAGVRVFPVNHRYAYPAELDLMARLAGFEREERWADWHGNPWTATSPDHVSVYRLTP
jgi:SAM-dependent methyltransferase